MDEDSISMKDKIESKSNIIKCIISEKMKLSEARNFCVDKIETEYFIPLDADDKIPENFIEEICKIESDVVYIGSEYFGSKSGVWPDPITEEITWTKLTTFRRNSLVCTALIKKESFIKSGKYKESLWAFEDMDLWIRMYKNKFVFKKCFNTKLLYRKHFLSESLLTQANSSEESRKELKKIIMNDDFYKRTPKIIHWVWIGDNPIPEMVLETWKKNLPEGEWTYMLWNEKNFDMNSSDFLKKSYELKKYGICVDYIRAKVLYEYGGVWLDADCIINNDISPFLQYDFFSSWENEKYLNIGLIGCKPKLEQIGNILEFYSNLKIESEVLNNQILFVNKVGTGPIVLTNEILKICDIRNGGFTKEFTHDGNRFLIETPDVFVLDDSISGRINYAVHLFDGSWTEKKEEWSSVIRKSYNEWKKINNI
jgi:mannosyltransferase OCH1-like enzyme